MAWGGFQPPFASHHVLFCYDREVPMFYDLGLYVYVDASVEVDTLMPQSRALFFTIHCLDWVCFVQD